MSLEYLPVDEKVVEYYLDAFKRWGVANVDEGPEAECESGILVNTSVECLELFSGPFCAVVNKDETQQATRNFTYEEVKAKDERSLHARQSLCASYVFNFDWTGADGDCKLSCTEAFSTLKSQCAVPVLGRLAPEGTLDVGCGNYTYQANREALFDPSSSVVLPSTTSTVTAVISPTEQFSTMASSSSTTAMSTKSATSTKEPEPAETNAYFGVHNLQCNKEDDYPGHASVQEEALTFEINNACRDVSKKGWHMTPKDDLIEWEYKDYVGVKHRFTWSWKKDCTAENGDVDLGNPLNEDDGVERCVFIFGEAWTRCECSTTLVGLTCVYLLTDLLQVTTVVLEVLKMLVVFNICWRLGFRCFIIVVQFNNCIPPMLELSSVPCSLSDISTRVQVSGCTNTLILAAAVGGLVGT